MSDNGTISHDVPMFCWTDEDGDVVLEWRFGIQGAKDSWGLLLCLSSDEGAYLIETRMDAQHYFQGDDVRPNLCRLLNEAKL